MRLGSVKIVRLFGLAAGAVLVTACSPFVVLNAMVPGEGYTVESAIPYGTHLRNRLDVYFPPQIFEPRPVVIFFYGGSWKRGQRTNYRFVGQALTSRGLVAVIPDYRTYPAGRFPDFMEDAAQALDWVLGHIREYGGDPARVYLLGHSAGAHIAALLTLDARYLDRLGLARCHLRGTVGLAGPYAFDPLAYRSVRPVFEHLEDPDVARPITFAQKGAPPMLLLHGGADTVVRPENSERLAKRLREVGSPARYVRYEDVGHVGIVLALAAGFRDKAPVLDDAVTFFRDEAGLKDGLALRCEQERGSGKAAQAGTAEPAQQGG